MSSRPSTASQAATTPYWPCRILAFHRTPRQLFRQNPAARMLIQSAMCFHQLFSGDGQLSGSVLDPLGSIRVRSVRDLSHQGLELLSGLFSPSRQFNDILKQSGTNLLLCGWWLAFRPRLRAAWTDWDAAFMQFGVRFAVGAFRHNIELIPEQGGCQLQS